MRRLSRVEKHSAKVAALLLCTYEYCEGAGESHRMCGGLASSVATKIVSAYPASSIPSITTYTHKYRVHIYRILRKHGTNVSIISLLSASDDSVFALRTRDNAFAAAKALLLTSIGELVSLRTRMLEYKQEDQVSRLTRNLILYRDRR